jgi:adenosylcobinamide kinase/adenosylcobinamide-phosphate guanylyltransferase
MSDIIFATGGGYRSGKKKYFLEYCEKLNLSGKMLHVTTMPILNDEMRTKIKQAEVQRDASLWDNVEEQINLADIFSGNNYQAILVDSLNMWIDNLIYKSPSVKEEDMIPFIEKTMMSLENFDGITVFLSDEMSMGGRPESLKEKKLMEFVSTANLIVSRKANTSVFFVSGNPLVIKGELKSF